MAGKQIVATEIKNEIIRKIKEEGAVAAELARSYGISDKTIYGWLRVGVSPGVTVIENNKLKRENQQLLLTIGLLTAELSKSKKGMPYGNFLSN